jgi:hypothetical protein
MSRIGKPLAIALLALCCQGARSASPKTLGELSPVERQQADFYGAIAGEGPGVKIAWTLERATVELGGDTELTLKILHAVNRAELLRPNLAERPEWKSLFGGIGDLPGAAPGEFRYRLKPRAIGEFELPLPKYRYYQPRAPEGRRFQVAFAEAPKLTVIPPAPVELPRIRIPVEAPAHFFDEEPLPSRSASAPPAGSWWLLLFLGAFAPTVSVALWRWRNPDAARLARIRRAKSARTALDAIRSAERAADPAGAIARALLRYFSDRWHITPTAGTPSEVSVALLADGRSPAMAAEAEALLALCDRERFSAHSDSEVSLAELAGRHIARWEEAGA